MVEGRRSPAWRRVLWPAVAAGIGMLVLLGLGTWQLERKAWKEALIATLDQRLADAPIALPAAATWPSLNQAVDEFRRVRLSVEFLYDREALVYTNGSSLRPDISGPGYWVFTPAKLPDGRLLMVNRGFVPQGRSRPPARAAGNVAGPVEIVGVLRWPEQRGLFVPAPDLDHSLFFSRDPHVIAAAKGLGAMPPFFIDQESPAPPGGLPKPGPLVVKLRNDHLQYAITWYALALALGAVFAFWARGRLHDDAPGTPSAAA